MVLLKYTVRIKEGLPVSVRNFRRFVQEVYDDERGIKSLFPGKVIDFVQVDNESGANFDIWLVKGDDVKRICNFDGLSCADMRKGRIYLNYENWRDGTPIFREGCLGRNWKDLYRKYLVNHETLHVLFLAEHPPEGIRYKKNEPVSIMLQQTVRLNGGRSNPWPRKDDIKYFRGVGIRDL